MIKVNYGDRCVSKKKPYPKLMQTNKDGAVWLFTSRCNAVKLSTPSPTSNYHLGFVSTNVDADNEAWSDYNEALTLQNE